MSPLQKKDLNFLGFENVLGTLGRHGLFHARQVRVDALGRHEYQVFKPGAKTEKQKRNGIPGKEMFFQCIETFFFPFLFIHFFSTCPSHPHEPPRARRGLSGLVLLDGSVRRKPSGACAPPRMGD
jgi:hypothetical protein